ncbi:hypothetical protein Lal_00041510 [Lupinus albus]|uniref:Putative bifunctional inhibitor/plant lipid transfer protein/seed storage helical n=1 Tax=Lupinus albus TaxID=3870 RepID=A0A6A4PA92_LUPAL|nr:putative bifunctional inhibitor/plant lipid transfer protein/seed storage helical [Lupinus albus]KAF1874066.1 hypothetical protein Lal_00041510 [Lupinus albus]
MASKVALMVSLNILFFTLVSSTYAPSPSPTLVSSIYDPSPSPSTFPNLLQYGNCSVGYYNFHVCADLFGLIGVPSGHPCCSILHGLVNIEAAVCLCTAFKLNVLGFSINIPIHLSYIFDTCGKDKPDNFKCT